PLEYEEHIRGVVIEGGRVVSVDMQKLEVDIEYLEREYFRVERLFQRADAAMARVLEYRDGAEARNLELFQDLCHTWLDQAREFMAIEKLRSYVGPDLKFVTQQDLVAIETNYGVRLGDVFKQSYLQEARNTDAIRKSNPDYDPYNIPKDADVDEKIKAMLPEGLKSILDMGCCDGRRTLAVYGETDAELYGSEISMAGEKAEKKGIRVCGENMLGGYYDDTCVFGREFDMVSILGQMVNYVGTDADKLLRIAASQVEDDGYLLLTCMHHTIGEEGEYVVWTESDHTAGNWVLDEVKIPRTYRLISEEGLMSHVAEAARDLGVEFHLEGKEVVEDFYRGMPVHVYLFSKK
ncbi:hypothetical protein ACFL0V_07120, partial [Nanoarchaeota archaeon]